MSSTVSDVGRPLRRLNATLIAILLFAIVSCIVAYMTRPILSVTLTVDKGKAIEIYINQKGIPIWRKLVLGGPHEYVFDWIDPDIQMLRVDPTDAAAATGIIHDVTVRRGFIPVLSIDFTKTKIQQSDLASFSISPGNVLNFVSEGNDPIFGFQIPRTTLLNTEPLFFASKYLIAVVAGALLLLFLFRSRPPPYGLFSILTALSKVALLLTFAVAGLSYYFVAWKAPDLTAIIAPEILAPEGADNMSQRRTHQIFFLTCMGISAAGLFAHRLSFLPGLAGGRFVLLVAAAYAFCGALFSYFYIIRVGSDLASYWTAAVSLIIIASLTLPSGRTNGSLRSNYIALGFLGVSAAYIAVIEIIGIVGPFPVPRAFVSEAWYIAFIEGHYALMPGFGMKLINGQKLFSEIPIWYGAGVGSVIASLPQSWRPTSFLGWIHAIQVLQVIFLMASAVAYYLWHRSLILVACSLLVIFPYVSTYADIPVQFPNFSAWRVMNFPLALVAFYWCRNLSLLSSCMALGGLSALLIVNNPETGFVLTVGAMAFVWGGHPQPFLRRIGQIPAALLGTLVLVGVAVSILLLAAFGPSLQELRVASSLGFLMLGQGVSGRILQSMLEPYNAIAAVIVGVSVAVICSSVFVVAPVRPLSSQGRMRLAVAVTICLWAGYFVNRPVNDWILWTLLFLSTFLLSDVLRALRLIKRWMNPLLGYFGGRLGAASNADHAPDQWRNPKRWFQLGDAIVIVCYTLFLLVPFVYQVHGRMLATGAQDKLRSLGSSDEVSGIPLSTALARTLRSEIEFIRSIPAGESVVYFTAHPFIIPLEAGRLPQYPFLDPYVELMRMETYVRVMNEICSARPKWLLVEQDGSTSYFNAFHRAFFQRLRRDISQCFVFSKVQDGWEIYHPATLPIGHINSVN
jgi:hypothetical protein